LKVSGDFVNKWGKGRGRRKEGKEEQGDK